MSHEHSPSPTRPIASRGQRDQKQPPTSTTPKQDAPQSGRRSAPSQNAPQSVFVRTCLSEPPTRQNNLSSVVGDRVVVHHTPAAEHTDLSAPRKENGSPALNSNVLSYPSFPPAAVPLNALTPSPPSPRPRTINQIGQTGQNLRQSDRASPGATIVHEPP